MSEANTNHKSMARQSTMLLAYYGTIALVTYLLVQFVPGFEEHLPVGGAEELSRHLDGNAIAPVQTFLPRTTGALHNSFHLFLSILAALLLMLPTSWIYMGTRRRKEISQAFVNTILALPIVVTGIVYIVQNSLALAFSLAGIVAGVRFRHTLKDAGDTTYLFSAILVGLATGIGAADVAIVVTMFFNFTVLGLWRSEYGSAATGTESFSHVWMTKKEQKSAGADNAADDDRDEPTP